MDSLLGDLWWQGVAGSGTAKKRPIPPGKYIINLKLAKYSRWKLSGWLVYDFGRRLELTVIAGQFGLLCREGYRKVSKPSLKSAPRVTAFLWYLSQNRIGVTIFELISYLYFVGGQFLLF